MVLIKLSWGPWWLLAFSPNGRIGDTAIFIHEANSFLKPQSSKLCVKNFPFLDEKRIQFTLFCSGITAKVCDEVNSKWSLDINVDVLVKNFGNLDLISWKTLSRIITSN